MIHHFFSRYSGKASQVVAQSLSVTEAKVLESITLGSVYVRGRRLRRDEFVLEGDYVRFHALPKRFALGEISWKERIVENHTDYVIADKPHGLPTHETVDNAEENLKVQLSQFLGEKLLVTHRLDQPAGGLVLLAKNEAFQRKFNRWLEEGRVTKRYEAVCESPVACGRVVHHMTKSSHAPKVLSDVPLENTQQCVLEIETCEKLSDGTFRVGIKLFTGRTHQIRAQLAKLAAPIVGDVLYGSQKEFDNGIALRSIELKFPDHFISNQSPAPLRKIES